MTHPVHPAIVHFPIACWVLGSLADLSGLFFTEATTEFAGILIMLGTLLAIPAMATGVMELIKIDSAAVEYQIASRHMNLILLSWTFYAVSLLLRFNNVESVSEWVSILLSLVGLLFLSLAGWYGAKLVYEYGVGVKRDS